MERKSRLSSAQIEKLIEHFVVGTPARSAAPFCKVSRKTAIAWYHRFRTIITTRLSREDLVFDGEVACDESYFGGHRKGKRGGGAAGKVAVFGILKGNGYVHAISVENTRASTLYPIIQKRVVPDSIVYTDTYAPYNILDTSRFHHMRINHVKEFVQGKHHINGIENFWRQAKRHLSSYNGIPQQHFDCYIKECEWRFNYRALANLRTTLYNWVAEVEKALH